MSTLIFITTVFVKVNKIRWHSKNYSGTILRLELQKYGGLQLMDLFSYNLFAQNVGPFTYFPDCFEGLCMKNSNILKMTPVKTPGN